MASQPSAYLGDGVTVVFDGRILQVLCGGMTIMLGRSGMDALDEFLRTMRGDASAKMECDVWHDGKGYRAVLLRELTLDEIYRGLK